MGRLGRPRQRATADECRIEHSGDVGFDTRQREDHVDRVLADFAGAQHGVVGRRQLLGAGVGRGSIAGRLRRGALHLVHHGVYAVGHAVLSAQGRWMAATLALGPGAVLSHRSAAELWGLVGRSSGPIELTVPGNSGRLRPGIRAHRSSLPADEKTQLDGIPVTTFPRAILDLAAIAPGERVERALHEAEVRGLTDRLSVPGLLERYPRRRGSVNLRLALEDHGAPPDRSKEELGPSLRGVPRNEFERRFAALIASHDLPRPRRNADIAAGDRFYNVDCLWAEQRLIVELDGRGTHGTRRSFESDRERDRVLIAEGWRVIRVTWRQLDRDGPRVVADLRHALVRRVST